VAAVPGRFLLVNLIERLGYAIPEPNRFQRLVQSVASTRPGSALLSRILMPIDRLLDRPDGSGTSLPRMLAGLPVISLTTVGRRSGLERKVFLVAIPVGDTLALIGTNWGRPETPHWVSNLRAEPRARIEYRGVAWRVRALEVDGPEHSEVMATAAGHYGGFLAYQRRITGRPIRIFVLDPTDS
jgi:deazaflavin-dependent oxidoreductase (nitroreductase family)